MAMAMAMAKANDEGEFDGWFCCCVLLVSLGPKYSPPWYPTLRGCHDGLGGSNPPKVHLTSPGATTPQGTEYLNNQETLSRSD